MRHVRWKLGRMSDKEFFEQEFLEMRSQEQYEEKGSKMARGQPLRRSMQGTGPTSTEHTEAEVRDWEALKKPRSVPVDFEENLDIHFDRKRVQI